MSDPALDFEDFIRIILESLQAVGIEYLVGGAIAAWAWGEPRATQDIDVVVNFRAEDIYPFSQELSQRGILIPAEVILDTIIGQRGDIPINLIHATSGFKADLYVLRPGDELRQSALKRRQRVDFGPPLGEIFIHSAEDLILYKLIYYDLSQQTKHTRDIGAILHSQKGKLNLEYLQIWTERLGLQTLWQAIRDEMNLY